MAHTVVFLWISAASSLPAAERHIADYGAARDLTLSRLDLSAAPAGLAAYDGALVDRLEAGLEQARTAISALEEDAAAERLERLATELSSHPHLPQAGFLLAECLALRAQLLRARDPQAASELESERAALEGPRAAAFDEPKSAASAAANELSLSVVGLEGLDTLELDGREVMARRVALAPGLHHVRVWRAGRPIHAAFLRVEPGQQQLVVSAPPLVPCSAEDLAARASGHPVACPSWALVRSEGRGVGVSLCRSNVCGAFSHWEERRQLPFRPVVAERARFPGWATVAIAGVASAAATSLLLWQAGAFEQGSSSAATFRYDGVNSGGSRR